MLLTRDNRPEFSVYYAGSIVIRALVECEERAVSLPILYAMTREDSALSPELFLLAIDWLYLVNAAVVDGEGRVSLCT